MTTNPPVTPANQPPANQPPTPQPAPKPTPMPAQVQAVAAYLTRTAGKQHGEALIKQYQQASAGGGKNAEAALRQVDDLRRRVVSEIQSGQDYFKYQDLWDSLEVPLQQKPASGGKIKTEVTSATPGLNATLKPILPQQVGSGSVGTSERTLFDKGINALQIAYNKIPELVSGVIDVMRSPAVMGGDEYADLEKVLGKEQTEAVRKAEADYLKRLYPNGRQAPNAAISKAIEKTLTTAVDRTADLYQSALDVADKTVDKFKADVYRVPAFGPDGVSGEGLVQLAADVTGQLGVLALTRGAGARMGLVKTATGLRNLTMAVSTLQSIRPSVEAARAAGYNDANAYRYAMTVSPIMGVMDSMFGVETLVGKIGGQQLKEKAMREALAKLGGELNEESFSNVVAETAKSYARLRSVSKQMLTEAVDEGGLQVAAEKGVQAIFNSLGGKDAGGQGNFDLSGDALSYDIANNFVAGLFGGGVGGIFFGGAGVLEPTIYSQIERGVRQGKDLGMITRGFAPALQKLQDEGVDMTPIRDNIIRMTEVAQSLKDTDLSPAQKFLYYDITTNDLPEIAGRYNQGIEIQSRLEALEQEYRDLTQNSGPTEMLAEKAQLGQQIRELIQQKEQYDEGEGARDQRRYNFLSEAIDGILTGKTTRETISEGMALIDRFSEGMEVELPDQSRGTVEAISDNGQRLTVGGTEYDAAQVSVYTPPAVPDTPAGLSPRLSSGLIPRESRPLSSYGAGDEIVIGGEDQPVRVVSIDPANDTLVINRGAGDEVVSISDLEADPTGFLGGFDADLALERDVQTRRAEARQQQMDTLRQQVGADRTDLLDRLAPDRIPERIRQLKKGDATDKKLAEYLQLRLEDLASQNADAQWLVAAVEEESLPPDLERRKAELEQGMTISDILRWQKMDDAALVAAYGRSAASRTKGAAETTEYLEILAAERGLNLGQPDGPQAAADVPALLELPPVAIDTMEVIDDETWDEIVTSEVVPQEIIDDIATRLLLGEGITERQAIIFSEDADYVAATMDRLINDIFDQPAPPPVPADPVADPVTAVGPPADPVVARVIADPLTEQMAKRKQGIEQKLSISDILRWRNLPNEELVSAYARAAATSPSSQVAQYLEILAVERGIDLGAGLVNQADVPALLTLPPVAIDTTEVIDDETWDRIVTSEVVPQEIIDDIATRLLLGDGITERQAAIFQEDADLIAATMDVLVDQLFNQPTNGQVQQVQGNAGQGNAAAGNSGATATGGRRRAGTAASTVPGAAGSTRPPMGATGISGVDGSSSAAGQAGGNTATGNGAGGQAGSSSAGSTGSVDGRLPATARPNLTGPQYGAVIKQNEALAWEMHQSGRITAEEYQRRLADMGIQPVAPPQTNPPGQDTATHKGYAIGTPFPENEAANQLATKSIKTLIDGLVAKGSGMTTTTAAVLMGTTKDSPDFKAVIDHLTNLGTITTEGTKIALKGQPVDGATATQTQTPPPASRPAKRSGTVKRSNHDFTFSDSGPHRQVEMMATSEAQAKKIAQAFRDTGGTLAVSVDGTLVSAVYDPAQKSVLTTAVTKVVDNYKSDQVSAVTTRGTAENIAAPARRAPGQPQMGAASQPVEVAAAQALVDRLSQAFPGVPVRIIPATDARADADGRPMAGYFDPQTGEVVLVEGRFGLDTPLEEFAHVFTAAAKSALPNRYRRGLDLVAGSEYEARARQDYAGYYSTDEEFQNEALGHAIRDAMNEQLAAEAEGRRAPLLQRVRDWWVGTLSRLADRTGLSWLQPRQTLEGFARRAAADILSGKVIAQGPVVDTTTDLPVPQWYEAEAINRLAGTGNEEARSKINRAEQARALQAEGVAAEEVFNQTGWWPTSNGKLVTEMGDRTQVSMPRETLYDISSDLEEEAVSNPNTYQEAYLGNIINNPTLFAAHPELVNLPVRFVANFTQPESAGYFDPVNSRIVINLFSHEQQINQQRGRTQGSQGTTEAIRISLGDRGGAVSRRDYRMEALKSAVEATITHELQHVVQRLGGVPGGGNEAAAYVALSEEYDRRMAAAVSNKERRDIRRWYQSMASLPSYEQYRRLEGEVFARDAERRNQLLAAGLKPELMRSSLPGSLDNQEPALNEMIPWAGTSAQQNSLWPKGVPLPDRISEADLKGFTLPADLKKELRDETKYHFVVDDTGELVAQRIPATHAADFAAGQAAVAKMKREAGGLTAAVLKAVTSNTGAQFNTLRTLSRFIAGTNEEGLGALLTKTVRNSARRAQRLGVMNNVFRERVFGRLKGLSDFGGMVDGPVRQIAVQGTGGTVELAADQVVNLVGQFRRVMANYGGFGTDGSGNARTTMEVYRTNPDTGKGEVVASVDLAELRRLESVVMGDADLSALLTDIRANLDANHPMLAETHLLSEASPLAQEREYWPLRVSPAMQAAAERNANRRSLSRTVEDAGILRTPKGPPAGLWAEDLATTLERYHQQTEAYVQLQPVIRNINHIRKVYGQQLEEAGLEGIVKALGEMQKSYDDPGRQQRAMAKNVLTRYGTMSVRLQSASLFSFPIGTRLKQATGLLSALQNGVIEDKYITDKFGTLARMVAKSFGRPDVTGELPAEILAIKAEIDATPGAELLSYRMAGKARPDLDFLPLDRTDYRTQQERSKKLRQFWAWQERYGSAGLHAADTAVIASIWEAAKAKVSAEQPGLTGPDYLAEVTRLAEEVVYESNQTYDKTDRSAWQLDANLFSRLLGLYQGHAFKIYDTMVRRGLDAALTDENDPKKAELQRQFRNSVIINTVATATFNVLIDGLVKMARDVGYNLLVPDEMEKWPEWKDTLMSFISGNLQALPVFGSIVSWGAALALDSQRAKDLQPGAVRMFSAQPEAITAAVKIIRPMVTDEFTTRKAAQKHYAEQIPKLIRSSALSLGVSYEGARQVAGLVEGGLKPETQPRQEQEKASLMYYLMNPDAERAPAKELDEEELLDQENQ